jgi:hypothetical protein
MMSLYPNFDLRRKNFRSFSDEELYIHVMSEFETKTYCRPRIGNILVKNLLKHLFDSYHI